MVCKTTPSYTKQSDEEVNTLLNDKCSSHRETLYIYNTLLNDKIFVSSRHFLMSNVEPIWQLYFVYIYIKKFYTLKQ